MRFAITLATALFVSSWLPAADWPQWLGAQRDGVWTETNLIDRFPKEGPKKLWSVPLGAGYSGPAIVGNRLFVMDRKLAAGSKLSTNAFSRDKVDGTERIVCLDVTTSKTLWEYSYPCVYTISYASGPRYTPTVHDGLVYALGAMGDLTCLNAETGQVVWKKNFVKDYGASPPVWGFSSHPLIDGDNLICIVGGPDNRLVVAFDKKTGQEKWTSLSCPGDFGYCPPMAYTFGGQKQIIIWHSKSVNGLDPATGSKIWSVPFEIKAALTAPTPRRVGDDKLFVTSFYNGSMLLKVTATSADIVWKSKAKGENPSQTTDLSSIIATPVIVGEHVYGVCSYGELRCLNVLTGERIWATNQATRGRKTPQKVAENPEPSTGPPRNERWSSAFLIPNGNRYFLFNEQGELIIAKLTPKGYEELDRAVLLEPNNNMAGRLVVWSHPGFSGTKIVVRNDDTIACFDLAKTAP